MEPKKITILAGESKYCDLNLLTQLSSLFEWNLDNENMSPEQFMQIIQGWINALRKKT